MILTGEQMDGEFHVDVFDRRDDGYVLVVVSGEVDEFSASLFAQSLEFAGASGRPMIVDLAGVDHFGVAGARVLDRWSPETLCPRTRARLVLPDDSFVHVVLASTGLTGRWPVHVDVAGALDALREDDPSTSIRRLFTDLPEVRARDRPNLP